MAQSVGEGDMAPDFQMDATGGGVTLSDFSGRWLVLYFYPKDNTPGCTTEAEDFTALADAFAAKNAVVVGVSPDSLKSHEGFVAKKALKVRLAADPDKATAMAYGVWVEKAMYGRTYMGVERATFLISPEGRVARVWRKVKVKGHAQAVLDAIAAP